MRNIFNSFTGSFFRTIGRVLAYVAIALVIAYFAGFINIGNVKALSNTGIFEDLTISENGMFYNNTNSSGVNSSLGYEVTTGFYGTNNEYEHSVAYPETEASLVNYGQTLTQCDMNLRANRNYAITYYFESGGAPYLYPPYSNTTYKMGISAGLSGANLSFNPIEWYSGNINTPYFGNFNYFHSFTLVFEAPSNGSCLSVSISTNQSATNMNYGFLGYDLVDFGEHVPTADEIEDALQQSFNDINSNIEEMHDHLNSNINASTNEILDKQEETNQALDDLNDNITDSNISGAEDVAGGFFDGFDNEDYGLSDIITMPLQVINNITSATCSPLELPLPFVDADVTLPCMYDIYEDHFGGFLTIYQTITFGIVAYWVCINIFRMVKNFKNPDNDEVEVLDL